MFWWYLWAGILVLCFISMCAYVGWLLIWALNDFEGYNFEEYDDD
jgi:hypothetical protein